MRARITLAVVAILVGALTVVGAISLTLERRAASEHAQHTVSRQAAALAASLTSKPLAKLFSNPDQRDTKAILQLVDKIAGTRSGVLVLVGGRLRTDTLTRIPPAAIDARRLALGRPISGVVAGIAFAAAPVLTLPDGSARLAGATGTLPVTLVALALEANVGYSTNSALYYLLASAIALLAAAASASFVARRISHRLLAASAAAERIASGDLEARVGLARNDYPELAGLGRSLNTMAAALASSRNLEREFLLSISHDLRTPLTSIRGYAEAIADRAAPEPAEAAQVVVAEALRLERLIGDLLDLARLDAHQFSLHEVLLDAGRCAAEAAEALRYEFEAVDVKLSVERPDFELRVSADPDRLAQVVSNLVENALKFARTSVRVSVGEATSPEHGVLVAVEDDGPGIAGEDLPHIFERQFSSSRRPARAAGTGLGLAIVAELTSAMRGAVDVDSPLGPEGGTRITVRLPRAAP